jgi:hypothetical protein
VTCRGSNQVSVDATIATSSFREARPSPLIQPRSPGCR